MIDQEEGPRRALLVAVQLSEVDDAALAASLIELSRLARTLGYEVVGQVTQKRGALDPGAYVGPGKRSEIKARVEAGECDTLLVDHEISPSQARNLEKECGADVLDRTAVILEIFHRHARSRAARAQVEIVRLQYMAPRMRETGRKKSGDRQRGGIGGKGAGESHLELDRRKIRDRIAELELELAAIGSEQATRRARRGELHRVALVGYTNAGKSTLMRALTGSDVYVADRLFATLDTTVRALHPETHPRILVSDTVGFIDKLPHGLVASFKSTLDEALEASLLIHVVDASDPACERQLAVTEEVIGEIGAGAIARLVVWNKMDRLGPAAAETEARLALVRPHGIALSAIRPDDVAVLRRAIVAAMTADLVEDELRVPWDQLALRGAIFAACEVTGERYDDGATWFRVRAAPGTIARLREQLHRPAAAP